MPTTIMNIVYIDLIDRCETHLALTSLTGYTSADQVHAALKNIAPSRKPLVCIAHPSLKGVWMPSSTPAPEYGWEKPIIGFAIADTKTKEAVVVLDPDHLPYVWRGALRAERKGNIAMVLFHLETPRNRMDGKRVSFQLHTITLGHPNDNELCTGSDDYSLLTAKEIGDYVKKGNSLFYFLTF